MSLSRRSFIGASLYATPFIMSGCRTAVKPRRIPANSRVNVAIIGCGVIARYTNVPGFLKDPRCRVTVACDMVKLAPRYFYGAGDGKGHGMDGLKVSGGAYRADVCGSTVIKQMVDAHYGDHSCREVFDWREVIDDPTIDAVCVSTPDHWHAIIAIAAMRAGKHVFCQKPLSLSIEEGQKMVRVAKETGVTFQVGNQGRNDPAVRLAEEIVINGYAGKVLGATVCIPGGDHWRGHGRSAARAPLPDYFSKEAWNLWQGPAAHWEDDAYIPSIHEPTCWRFNSRYGGGMIPDFGAHEFDELQRGLGMDLSGPVAIENMKSDWAERTERDVFSWASTFDYEYVYANGLRARVRTIDEKAGFPRQTIFHCEKGDVGQINEKGVVPECLKKFRESDLKDGDVRLYAAKNGHDAEEMHESDFIDGVVEARQCCSPCEVGHRTITLAHLANICQRLQVSSLGWDPAAERFTGPNAEAAARLNHTEYANGWSI